ncbi:MAG: lipopolysaccharide heptosyltransferase II [Ignavibacteriales bacterium]|nr:lipopolysaccharide heptosyltransferase II [Ignavibacteriales bacterium]
MAKSFNKILVIQTAFIGDAILTLPLLQALKLNYPQSSIDVIVVPRAAEIFAHHPAISKIIQYDKRGSDKGLKGLWRLRTKLSAHHYDLIIVPHRSLRSALLTWLLKPTLSVGFDRSAGPWLFKKRVRYNPSDHEIERNLSLLSPLKLPPHEAELPRLYPSNQDAQIIDSLMNDNGLNRYTNIVAIAPGTIWNTKRWPAERFASLCKQIASENVALVLVGGSEDEVLSKEIIEIAQAAHVFSVAGKLSLLQSAELIRRCNVLISNDSAPMHIAVAVGTPVVAIFGATVPEFGFAPRGPRDVVIETKGLQCRPCSSHGGNMCPIKTFECMLSITPEVVVSKVRKFLQK